MTNLERSLKHFVNFEIITPLTDKRPISFEEPFQDVEFTSYTVDGNILNLHSEDTICAKLIFDGNYLSGNDSRGGKCVIMPEKTSQKEFSEFFKTNRTLVEEKYLQMPVESDTLIGKISIITTNNYEGFNCVRPSREGLFQIVEDLFKKGSKYVFVIDSDISLSGVKLLKNLCDIYYSGEIGSIQIHNTSPVPGLLNQLMYTDSDPKCFAISSHIWAEIRGKMGQRFTNFHYNFKKQLKDKKLKRLSTAMSRVGVTDSNDPRRKNFDII